jgi:hypothetical protein
MKKPRVPHPGHNKHMCYLANLGIQVRKPKSYVKLVGQPKYLCRSCGRVAENAKNLCFPAEM